MTRTEMLGFAERWAAAWTARDIDAVLGHYADNIEFLSPKAVPVVGSARVLGKSALSVYWRAALAKLPSVQMTLERIVWDPESRELAVLYVADLNGQRARACELMRFGPDWKIVQGEALYGSAL